MSGKPRARCQEQPLIKRYASNLYYVTNITDLHMFLLTPSNKVVDEEFWLAEDSDGDQRIEIHPLNEHPGEGTETAIFPEHLKNFAQHRLLTPK